MGGRFGNRRYPFKVGDLVVLNRISGVWARDEKESRWIDWPQEPVFGIVKAIVKKVPHSGDPSHCVQVACKDFTGCVGAPLTSWEDPKMLRRVLKSEAVKELLAGLPEEPHYES